MRPRNPAPARLSAGEPKSRHAGYTWRGESSTAGSCSWLYLFKCSGSDPRVQRKKIPWGADLYEFLMASQRLLEDSTDMLKHGRGVSCAERIARLWSLGFSRSEERHVGKECRSRW